MQEIIAYLSSNSPHRAELLITWGVAGFLLFALVILNLVKIREYLSERHMLRSLNRLGRESMHGVLLPDGIEGEIYLEHLVLTPQAILSVRVKRYSGVIFAAENIEFWTQVMGKKSYKFENPLRQLENDMQVIKMHVGDARVECKALFVKGSQFPKGKPASVISIEELNTLQRDFKAEEVPATLYTAWKRLVEVAKKDDLNYQRGVVIDNRTANNSRFLPSLALSVGLLFWLVWRLVV